MQYTAIINVLYSGESLLITKTLKQVIRFPNYFKRSSLCKYIEIYMKSIL